MIINRDSRTHWTMILEEEEHQYLLIMKWSTIIPSLQVGHLTKPWSGFVASLLQGTQPSSSTAQEEIF